ncbi:spore germination protein [Bacillus sp. S/N-304-OC-R1]|uniref:spore germination protein n=1 Tax=Bacillus sp. S/N-304-OC-R1 TaxID=2758034 RepID=UPI001C8D48B6|nr:spore germination protein [Bacillus sp. S/N-304-OC-R1]MBY0124374.1 spore germination protein [Bacillus sp. S/N-304-OC-R1]
MVFIGSVTIKNISGSATVHFGNTKTISPASSSSTTTGSGSGNTGAITITYPGMTSAASNTSNAGSSNRINNVKVEFSID